MNANLMVGIALLLAATSCHGPEVTSGIIWDIDPARLPGGLVLRVDDFLEDILSGNPAVVRENVDPVHLAYDIGDNLDHYSVYTARILLDGLDRDTSDSRFIAERYWEISRFRIEGWRVEELSNGPRHFVTGTMWLGTVKRPFGVMVHQNPGNPSLRIVFGVKPGSVG